MSAASSNETYTLKEKIWAKSGVAYYKAVIIEVDHTRKNDPYKIHYEKFSKRYDEWISPSKLLKMTKENSAFARKLFHDALKKEKEQVEIEKEKEKMKMKKQDEDADGRKGLAKPKKKKGFLLFH